MKSKRRNKRINKTTICSIESLGYDARGISKQNDKVTFINNALPGEKVICKYTKTNRKFDEADTSFIIKPSIHRIKEKCKHFTMCGGCQMQHTSKNYQIYHKQQHLLDELKQQTKQQPNNILNPIQGPGYNYRRKARIGLKYLTNKDCLVMGFREINGRFITNSEQCPILHQDMYNFLLKLKKVIHQCDCKMQVPQIEVAAGDENIAFIIRVLCPLTEHDKDLLQKFSLCYPELRLYIQPNKPQQRYLISQQSIANDYLYYVIKEENIKIAFDPTEFIQINAAINEAMIKQAIHLLQPKKHESIIDLFCGIGNFTLPLAKYCREVTGVEGNPTAIDIAKYNAVENAINNCQFHLADLSLTPQQACWAKKTYDAVLLDPSRAGAKEIIALLPQWQPQRILYVSCHTATLARDAATILSMGYTMSHAGIMDMFPQTKHAEAMVLFTKNS